MTKKYLSELLRLIVGRSLRLVQSNVDELNDAVVLNRCSISSTTFENYLQREILIERSDVFW